MAAVTPLYMDAGASTSFQPTGSGTKIEDGPFLISISAEHNLGAFFH